MLWLMDWLMQDAAKDLENAEEDRMGEEPAGLRGGGPAGAKAGGGAGGGDLAPGAGGGGEQAGTTAGAEDHGAESLRAGRKAEGSRSLSCRGEDEVPGGQLGPDSLVPEPCRSGFLQAQKRER